ncbi:hypothetical protein KUTeg_017771, partial [Tegillarca granosa]
MYKWLTMFPSYFVLFFFGFHLQLQAIVDSCPPTESSDIAAKVIQFCSGSEVTSHTIYMDSSDASTRVTNCTCRFSATNDTTILLKTTSNQNNDCRTNIKFEAENFPLTDNCGRINAAIGTQTGFNFTLMLTNGEVGR